MRVEIPESLNMADWFLHARVREGLGDKTAILCGERRLSYADVARLSIRFGEVLRGLGVEPEQRVIIALPDVPEFAGALFGTIGIGFHVKRFYR